jgi:hypothetical protein
MSYLASSPITLNSIPLQVSDGGFSIGSLTTIDEVEPWLSRSVLAGLRDADDALGFDMVTLTGKRIRVDYVGTGHAVPVNNELALEGLHRKVLRRRISISGSTMDASDYASFLASNDAAQQYWAKRAKLLSQLGDADITYDKVQALATDYLAANTSRPVLAFASPFFTNDVIFAEGDSCSFTSYIENIVTDFKLELIFDVELT